MKMYRYVRRFLFPTVRDRHFFKKKNQLLLHAFVQSHQELFFLPRIYGTKKRSAKFLRGLAVREKAWFISDARTQKVRRKTERSRNEKQAAENSGNCQGGDFQP